MSTTVEESMAGPRSKSVGINGLGSAELLETDPNELRRKRRKTASPSSKSILDNDKKAVLPKSLPQTHENRNEDIRFSTICQGDESVPPDSSERTTLLADSREKPILHVSADKQSPASLFEDFKPERERITNIITQPNDMETNPNDVACAPHATDVSIMVDASTNIVNPKPKKILRLNPKTGTIGSPPSKTSIRLTDGNLKRRPASRAKRRTSRLSRLVTIQYDSSDPQSSGLGPKIEAILTGTRTAATLIEKKVEEASGISKPPKSMKVAGNGPIDATHPFFLSKTAVKPSSLQTDRGTFPETTEIPEKGVSLLGGARLNSREQLSKAPKPIALGLPRTESNSRAKILKFPGAVEPAWPWKGMAHIRGEKPREGSTTTSHMLLSRSKRSKYQAVDVLADEDIIRTLTTELSIKNVLRELTDVDPDQYPPLPACLRVPTKHFEAAPSVQRMLRGELKAQLSPISEDNITESSEDETQGELSGGSAIHPALSKIYKSIATSLSAFDRSQCETQAWTQKYSPSSTVEVLQTGREALILKEWLQNSTVMAVESGSSDRPASHASSTSKRSGSAKIDPSVKRKRKSTKLDGFIISSDEEEDDMTELSEPEDEGLSSGRSQGLLKKTVIRSGHAAAGGSKDAAKFCNGVVISGPHGCGKSAAVYAVAKELGFEVFEINSSSRRSGKDIIEKVGDMTRNHLVQQSHTRVSVEPIDEDAKRISDALDDDLRSGRQGTMNSFFKVRQPTKPKSKARISVPTKDASISKLSVAPKAPTTKQKQSLILLEEVDVLYGEDKQFWATVMGLLLQSKRPIIMTCTDESAVPLQMLSLHAILRFSPPPIDLATDYMLLVAASEGHILRRESVQILYESRRLDLRASLTDLNFWCQFAVGSFKGGLDWFYPRWPPGNDVDHHGNIIRVISEGSYEPGMGLLSQDFLVNHGNCPDIEEEIMHEAWDGWHLDVGDWSNNPNLDRRTDRRQYFSSGQNNVRTTLGIYDDFAESMSAADVCSASAFSTANAVLMDTSMPELSLKVREDYVLAHELIEAIPIVDFHHLGKDIGICIKSRSRKYINDQHIQANLEIPMGLDRLDETHVLNLIRRQSLCVKSFLSRSDLSIAFDPISEPEKGSLYNSGFLEASAFDRGSALIATDVAPFVRSIVSYDARLQQDRARLSNLLSEGGRRGKRMRTTRAALSALEGGARSTTRREKYFGPGLNPYFVLKTGMQSWLDAVQTELSDSGATSRSSESIKETLSLSRVESESERDELVEE